MLEARALLYAYVEAHQGIVTFARDDEGVLRPVVREPPPLSPRLSILIGETAYNLRSALDHMVYVLACYGARKDVRGTQFPIEDDPDNFIGRTTGTHPVSGKRMQHMLNGVRPSHVKLIGRLQPYNPGAEWTRTLRELSNPDKHRTLTPLLVEGRVDDLDVPKQLIWEPGQETQEVDIRYHVEIEPQLGDLELPLLPTLKLLHDQVEATVELFKPLFRSRQGV